jgi:hypothetical protein
MSIFTSPWESSLQRLCLPVPRVEAFTSYRSKPHLQLTCEETWYSSRPIASHLRGGYGGEGGGVKEDGGGVFVGLGGGKGVREGWCKVRCEDCAFHAALHI